MEQTVHRIGGFRLPRGFSSQEYQIVLPFPSPGDLPDPGIKPGSPTLEADVLTSEPPGKPVSEVIGISPSNFDSSLRFFQSSVSHDVLCILELCAQDWAGLMESEKPHKQHPRGPGQAWESPQVPS